MANAPSRRFHFVALNVLWLALSLPTFLAQETDDEKCSWYVSVEKDLTVRWEGEDRNATVTVDFITKDTDNRDCKGKESIAVHFRERMVKPKTICSNAAYEIVSTVTCDTVQKVLTNTIRTPPDPPDIYDVTASQTTLRVSWKAPPGSIQAYNVSLLQGAHRVQSVNVSGTTHFATFGDLKPYTQYGVSGRSFNQQGGWSHWSEVKDIRTEVAVPHAPQNPRVMNSSTSSLTLQWEEPTPSTGPVLQYVVKWAEEKSDQTYANGKTDHTFFVLENLFSFTEYSIKIYAETEAGTGPSADIKATTLLEVPDPPELKVSGTQNTSISVSWTLSPLYRGPLPAYSLRWRRNTDESYTSQDVENRASSYTLPGLSPYTTYEVQVRGRNDAGVGRWSEAQVVRTGVGVPSTPRKLRVYSKTATDVTVEWDIPDPPNGPVSEIRYSVAWRTKPEASGVLERSGFTNDSTNETRFLAADLEPYADYEFQVQAECGVGSSDWTGILPVKTDISAPSAPRNLKETESKNTSLEIQWDAPEHKNGPYVTYMVTWWISDQEPPEIWGQDGLNGTQYAVTDLQPYCNYSIQVCAATSAGTGPCTEAVRMQTMAGIPDIPRSVRATKVESTSLLVEWDDPLSTNGPLDGYVLVWGVRDTMGSWMQTTQNSYVALGLRPYTEYFFEVAAETEGGKGPFNAIYRRTAPSVPSAPRNVLVTQVTDHCILLEWSPPEHPNGPTLQYTARWQKVSSESNAQTELMNGTTFRIRNLEPSANYSVEISASTTVGRGRWTESLYITTERKDYSSAIIAGTTVGVLLLLLVIAIVALFILAKKKGGFQNIIPKKTAAAASSETLESTVSLPMNVLSDSQTVSVGNFDQHVLKLMANGYYKLAQEFERLGKECPAFPSDEAKKSDNLTKNRWVKILPFDHTRVKLRPVGDEVDGDFINASYVPGFSYLLEYIATQGPLVNTVVDFWRMAWQESVFTIIMLTQCVERAKRTCERYWPPAGESRTYGQIRVQTLSESITPSYVMRVFLVSQEKQQRHIVQLHYMNWPVSGCPKSPEDFLSFVKTVRGHISCAVTGPMIVHCSAGIGRTGTFIAVDRLCQQIEHGIEEVDVYGTVLEMRRYRANMVQTEEQYYFIYLCIQRIIQEKRQELENDYGGGIYSN